jgi:hypothetical protein
MFAASTAAATAVPKELPTVRRTWLKLTELPNSLVATLRATSAGGTTDGTCGPRDNHRFTGAETCTTDECGVRSTVSDTETSCFSIGHGVWDARYLRLWNDCNFTEGSVLHYGQNPVSRGDVKHLRTRVDHFSSSFHAQSKWSFRLYLVSALGQQEVGVVQARRGDDDLHILRPTPGVDDVFNDETAP